MDGPSSALERLRRLPALAIAVPLGWAGTLFAIVFARVLPSSVALSHRDVFRLFLPVRDFAARELSQGRFPTWYPFDGIGTPLWGAGIGGLFSPLAWLSVVLGPLQGLKWEVLACYPIAGIGAALLARQLGAGTPQRLLAGTAYALSGYLLSKSDNPLYLASAAFLPWTALAAHALGRAPAPRHVAALAVALAMPCWSGDVQSAGLQAVLAVVIVAAEGSAAGRARTLAALGASALLAGGLVAPLVGPLMAGAAESGRLGGLSLPEVFAWSLHPVRLLELAVGPSFTPEQLDRWSGGLARFFGGFDESLWASSEAMGVLPLLFAAAAAANLKDARRRSYTGLGIVCVLLAMGRWGGLGFVLARWVPAWRMFRYPEKFMPFAVLSIAVLAALGLQDVTERIRRAGWILGGGALLLASALVAARLGFHPLLPSVAAMPAVILEGVEATLDARLAVALGAVAVAWAVAHFTPRALGAASLVVTGIQLCWLAVGVVRTAPSAELLAAPRLLPALSLAQAADPGALCSWPRRYGYGDGIPRAGLAAAQEGDREAIVPDLGELDGIQDIYTYLPARDRALVDACGMQPECSSACARRMGARYGIASADVFPKLPGRSRLEELGRIENPHLVLFRDPDARPLVTLASARHLPDPAALSRAVATDPPDAILLPGEGPDEAAPGGSLSWSRPAPDQLQVDLSLLAAGWVVVAQRCAAGWRAQLDGAPVALERADVALCAIRVPAGAHRLRLRYVPPGWPGAFVPYSAAWLLVLLCLSFTAWRRRGA